MDHYLLGNNLEKYFELSEIKLLNAMEIILLISYFALKNSVDKCNKILGYLKRLDTKKLSDS